MDFISQLALQRSPQQGQGQTASAASEQASKSKQNNKFSDLFSVQNSFQNEMNGYSTSRFVESLLFQVSPVSVRSVSAPQPQHQHHPQHGSNSTPDATTRSTTDPVLVSSAARVTPASHFDGDDSSCDDHDEAVGPYTGKFLKGEAFKFKSLISPEPLLLPPQAVPQQLQLHGTRGSASSSLTNIFSSYSRSANASAAATAAAAATAIANATAAASAAANANGKARVIDQRTDVAAGAAGAARRAGGAAAGLAAGRSSHSPDAYDDATSPWPDGVFQ